MRGINEVLSHFNFLSYIAKKNVMSIYTVASDEAATFLDLETLSSRLGLAVTEATFPSDTY